MAVASWARKLVFSRPDILHIVVIGSYARRDWGVGSDLDLVLVVKESAEPFEKRNLAFDASALPVPVDLLVYTEDEWRQLAGEGGRFYTTVMREGNWIHGGIVA